MEKIIEIKNLEVNFKTNDKTTYAVNQVYFPVYEGETLGIVGESGSGKSVTAKSIMRLIDRNNIISGQINFKGRDILSMKERELRNLRGDQISMVFQDPMTSLNPLFTIGQQMVKLIRRHRKLSKKEAEELAIHWLDQVGIPDSRERLNSYPHEFSGGMRQRVIIAMALCLEPDLVIADEPTTALDVTIQAQVLNLLNELKEKENRSVILITHDLGVVANTCNRVIVMYGGRILESGSTEEIFTNPKHPYTRGLLSSLPRKDQKERLTPIKGNPPNMTEKPRACPFKDRCDYRMEICSKKMPEEHKHSISHYSRCFLNEEAKHDQ